MLEPNDFQFRLGRLRDSLWFAGLLLTCYLGAIVLANYLITRYGQIAVPFVAFALIPFDLVARDLMQDHWNHVPNLSPSRKSKGKLYVFKRMVVVILLGAVISYLTGTGSLRVNLASCSAFIVAGSIDALTYQWMIKYGRIFRINGATITAAITDSIIFVSIAFATVNWKLVGLQIGMKVSGGFVWSLLLYRLFRKPVSQECWLCFGGGRENRICQHHYPKLGSTTNVTVGCNLRCNQNALMVCMRGEE